VSAVPVPPPQGQAPVAAPGATPWWRAFFGSEGWLLLLSLVLAVMVWILVRTLVSTSATIEVHVLPLAPDGAHAATTGKVRFRLHGKRGEVEAAITAVDRARGTVELDVGELPAGVTERPFRVGVDAYLLPFPMRLLEDPTRPPMPEGEVVRVERRSVRVKAPEVLTPPPWPEGLVVTALVPDVPLELSAPSRALDDVLVPDPVDATKHVKPNSPLTATVEVDLSFDAWRQGRVGGRPDERVARRRVAVVLPRVKATLKLELREQAPLTNSVEVLVRRGYQVVDLRPPPGAALTGKLSVESPGERIEVTFTGDARGTREVLRDLADRPDAWRWVLRVPDEDLPEDLDQPKTVSATLSFVGLDRFARLVSDGHVAFAPLTFPVEVRRLR
jgi:hypothetical protein